MTRAPPPRRRWSRTWCRGSGASCRPPTRRSRTRGHAYELALDDGALDAARFERLLGDGRRLLGARRRGGEPRRLPRRWTLWRGPRAGRVRRGESWARADEVARLEEQRLDGARGPDRGRPRRWAATLTLVAELRGAGRASSRCASGLRAQLMLALYRSRPPGGGARGLRRRAPRAGRRARARAPGPALARLHAAILQQDPALDSPRTRGARGSTPRGGGRAGGCSLAGAALLVLAAAATVARARRSGRRPDSGARGRPRRRRSAGGAGRGDGPRSERRIPAGDTLSNLDRVREGEVWLVDAEARNGVAASAARRAPWRSWRRGRRRSMSPRAAGRGVGRERPAARETSQCAGAGRRPRWRGSIPETKPRRRRLVACRAGGAVGRTAAWGQPRHHARCGVGGTARDFSVARIDPVDSNRSPRRRAGCGRAPIAAGGAGVWALGTDGTLVGARRADGARSSAGVQLPKLGRRRAGRR